MHGAGRRFSIHLRSLLGYGQRVTHRTSPASSKPKNSGAPLASRAVGGRALVGLLLAVAPALVACSGSEDSGIRELTPERLETFAKNLDSAREHLEVPGAAYAIVSHGTVLDSRGLGVRSLATEQPVTADTLFRIGSLTKGMSSALIANRVDEGAVGWDTLATSIDPNFKLSDDALTVSVTLEELLGMGTGIGAPPPFWWEYQTADDVIAAASTAAKAGARGSFVYNEEVYATGVYLGVAAGGETRPLLEAYNAELEERIMTPLGMAPAKVADDPAEVGPDFATSYGLSMVEQVSFQAEAPPFPLGALAPSNGVITSVNQYAKFLIAEMQAGLGANGERIATDLNIQRTQMGQTLIPSALWGTYAMGWVKDKDVGRVLYWHDGSVDGYRSYALWFPLDQVGLVIFTNGSNGDRLSWLARGLLMNALYGQSGFSVTSIQAQYDSDKVDLQTEVSKLRTQFTTELYAPYLGNYEHGFSLAEHDDGTLWLEAPGVSGRLLDASAVSAPGILMIGNGQYVGTLVQFVGNGADDPRLEFVAGSPPKPVTIIRKVRE